MKVIKFGDRSENQTGHEKDMHFGDATLCFNPNAKLYAVPGAWGPLPGVQCRFVSLETAQKIVVHLDKMIQRAWLKRGK